MGTRTIAGTCSDAPQCAVMYDSVSMWAFGPIFPNRSTADAFIEWLTDDPRAYRDGQLEQLYANWREEPGKRCPSHICDNECDENPGSCPIFKAAVGYPGFTK